LKSILFLAIFTVFFAISGICGTSFFTEVEVADWSSLGYKSPALDFMASAEISHKKFLWVNGFSYSPTDKIVYGHVDQLSVKSELLWRIPHKFLLGGGATAGKIYFHKYFSDYFSANPYVLGGLEWEDSGSDLHGRVIFKWAMPGFDDRYHISTFSFQALFASRRFRMGPVISYSRFYPKGAPSMKFSSVAGGMTCGFKWS